MAMCKHGFHNGVINTCYNLVSVYPQNFYGVGSESNMFMLKSDDGFLPYNMSEVFTKTGHGLTTDILIA